MGVMLSWVGVICGVLALAGALYALREVRRSSAAHLQAEFDDLKQEFGGLKHAFGKLEADAEDIWEKAQTHLGRISRMKRELKLPPGAALAAAIADANAGPGLAVPDKNGQQPPATATPGYIDPDRMYAEWLRKH